MTSVVRHVIKVLHREPPISELSAAGGSEPRSLAVIGIAGTFPAPLLGHQLFDSDHRRDRRQAAFGPPIPVQASSLRLIGSKNEL